MTENISNEYYNGQKCKFYILNYQNRLVVLADYPFHFVFVSFVSLRGLVYLLGFFDPLLTRKILVRKKKEMKI